MTTGIVQQPLTTGVSTNLGTSSTGVYREGEVFDTTDVYLGEHRDIKAPKYEEVP